MQGVVQKVGFCYVVHSNWRTLGIGLSSFALQMCCLAPKGLKMAGMTDPCRAVAVSAA